MLEDIDKSLAGTGRVMVAKKKKITVWADAVNMGEGTKIALTPYQAYEKGKEEGRQIGMTQGLCIVIGTLLRTYDQPSMAEEIWRSAGLSI